jgi:uncharacterized membrane protein YjgN (DUF898 family)
MSAVENFDTVQPGAQAGPGVSLRLGQTSRNGPFWMLSLVNGLLNLVTLTLYRFWGRTNVRRQLWRDTTLNGEPFEYTGTGGELFKGFLIALVVFTIPYLVLVFAGQMLPPLIGIPLILVVALVAYWGIGAAIWLAFRYISSRTTWRGIRFELIGKPVDYAWIYFQQVILNTITLGWWTPRMDIRTSAELWGNLFYGSIRFSFDEEEARRENLYGPFAILWLAGAGGYVLLILAVFGMGFSGFMTPSDPDAVPDMINVLVVLYAGAFLWLLALILGAAPYQAALLRAMARGLSIEAARFSSQSRWPGLLWLNFSNVLLLTVSLGLLSPLVQARSFRYVLSRIASEGHVNLEAATQAERGPNQAEGLDDALDLGLG